MSDVFLKSVKTIDSDINGFWKEIDSVDKKLSVLLGQYIKAGETTSAIDIAILKTSLENTMIESGYFQVVDDILNKEYQKIIDLNYADYKTIFPEGLQYSDVTMETLNNLKELDYSEFAQLSDNMNQNLTRVIINQQLGILTKDMAVEEITKYTGQFSKYSKTWVDTAISGYYRESSEKLGTDMGIELWEYFGPDDKITRPFCHDQLIANQQLTIEQWNQKSNGQINPVSKYGGGYNCRHRLLPVVKNIEPKTKPKNK